MDTRKYLCLHKIGILLCLLLSPISRAQTQTDDENLDELLEAFGQGQQQRYDAFEWNLLRELKDPDFGNVLISPISIKLVLAMLYEGASGTTEKELEQVVNFPANKQDTKKKFQKIIKSLKTSSPGQTLDMGSRVFIDNSIKPEQRFEGVLRAFYDTDVKPVDFQNASYTKDEVNYWVSNVTHGYIKDLVSEGDLEGATMLMANALFFKGLWATPFPRDNTYYGGFYTSPQRAINNVPFMHIEHQFYFSDSIELDAKILRLPFQGSRIAMFILLPNSKGGLTNLIRQLNPEALRRQMYLMQNDETINVYLPRFSFDFNAKLGRILQSLGLNHVFQNTASLAGIARGNGGVVKKLRVSNILQKSGIDVNEEGSTAYAATSLTLGTRLGAAQKFNASHPFLFYIEDEFTGNVLFVGKVENPIQSIQPKFKEELNFPSRFGETQEENTSPSSSSSGPSSSSSIPVTSQVPVVASSEPQSHRLPNNRPFPNQHFFDEPEPTDLRDKDFFYFDRDLIKAILNDQPEGNVLISPLSIKTVLAMVMEGSEGETRRQLETVLHLTSRNNIPDQFRKLLEVFQKSNMFVDLKIANKMYVGNEYSIVTHFQGIIKKYYNSDIEKLDSNNPVESARKINEWVNRATQGTIREIVENGNVKDIKILLANALYFKGKWQKKFSEQGTKIARFCLANGACQMTPMMDVVDDFKYAEVKEWSGSQVVEIPYTGEEYSMVIVLPKDAKLLKQVQNDIRTSVSHFVNGLNKTEVFISLPRFRINYNVDIINYLPSVGITNMQSTNANITGIVVDVGTRVSNLLHKTFIDVNEEGTVASAATGAMVIPLMGVSKPRVRVDRPFLFFIRHIPTGTILFEGRVMQPEVAQQNTNQPQIPQRHPIPQQNQNQPQNPNQPPSPNQPQSPQLPSNQQPNLQRVPSQQIPQGTPQTHHQIPPGAPQNRHQIVPIPPQFTPVEQQNPPIRHQPTEFVSYPTLQNAENYNQHVFPEYSHANRNQNHQTPSALASIQDPLSTPLIDQFGYQEASGKPSQTNPPQNYLQGPIYRPQNDAPSANGLGATSSGPNNADRIHFIGCTSDNNNNCNN